MVDFYRHEYDNKAYEKLQRYYQLSPRAASSEVWEGG